MRPAICFALGLAASLSARAVPADEYPNSVGQPPEAMKGVGFVFTFGRRMRLGANYDNKIKVDVVVDVTDAGEKIPRPTSDHPVYFYPVTRGYTLGQAIIEGEKPPPPTADVQRLIVVALAKQGYLLATKQSPPTLLLMFWWGYKVPVMAGATNGGATTLASANGGGVGGSPGNALDGINRAAQSGLLPTEVMTNESEMEDLVLGATHDRNTDQMDPGLRIQALTAAARNPRYYVMVSALDFAAAAQQKKVIVLWTARISTDLEGHTLEEVLPTLIASGAPMFGQDTNGALWPFPSVPLVPMGHVEVGTPYLKTDSITP
jgi:hypothetical protein